MRSTHDWPPSEEERQLTLETVTQHVFNFFNICEGVLWIGIALGFAFVYGRRRQNGDLMAAAGLLFATFGLSDFVEIQTGGWYKPWWLLAWKSPNLLGLAIVYALFRRRSLK
jgi:hypothetical protein